MGFDPRAREIRSIPFILEQQAQALTHATKGLLEGRVRINNRPSGTFLTDLLIVAPSMNNYRYEVLTVSHGIEMFPADVTAGEGTAGRTPITCEDEAQFEAAIAQVLQSDRVQKVIRGLLGMMRSAA